LGNFLLLFCWIYCISLWLAPLHLLQWPWFTGLIFWWSHWVLASSFWSYWEFGLMVLLFLFFVCLFVFSIYFVFKSWNPVFYIF
jgi:hypothetical protein